MPLSKLQKLIAQIIAKNRSLDSHLAGGAALHFEPRSIRYSNDLDYFQDSVERVATAFNADSDLLTAEGFKLSIEIAQPGFIRALVGKGSETTKVEWAFDSAWRFLPAVKDEDLGYRLHPIDLSINKLLALAGRDEPRDFLDVLHVHQKVLHLGALTWAAVGKDPGFSPSSLLELLKRKGRYREEDFKVLKLVKQPDLKALKSVWLAALSETEKLFDILPPKDCGCLYFSKSSRRFVCPKESEDLANLICHFGTAGGVLPRLMDDARFLSSSFLETMDIV